jgi:hypothetical protein
VVVRRPCRGLGGVQVWPGVCSLLCSLSSTLLAVLPRHSSGCVASAHAYTQGTSADRCPLLLLARSVSSFSVVWQPLTRLLLQQFCIFTLTMKAFASLLSSKKKHSPTSQLDGPSHAQSRISLPVPGRETHLGHPKTHGTRAGSLPAAPLIPLHAVPIQHDRGGPSPSQPRQDAHSPSRYLNPLPLPLPPPTKHPPRSTKRQPSFFLHPRLNKSVAHIHTEAPQRSSCSWVTNDSDPFAAPSYSTTQHPSPSHLSVPPPPIPPRHEPASSYHPQLNGHSPLSFNSRTGSDTNDVLPASDLYQRRRARSVGPRCAPSPDFPLKYANLLPIPSIVPLRLTKDTPPVPKQLPTPSTPSAPASISMHSRVLSGGSTRSLTYKKSLPCIEGVWNDFLKEVEEDIESLTAARSEKELLTPLPPKPSPPKRPLPLPTCRPRSKTLGSSTIIEKGLLSPGPLTPHRDCFSPMPIIVTPSVSREEVISSLLSPPNIAPPQPKPTSVSCEATSLLPYLGSESSMTTASDLSLSLFPCPPSVPIRRPTDTKGILRTRLTQPPHPPPSRPIPPIPDSPEGRLIPTYTAVSQEKGTELFTLLELPATPGIRLPEISKMTNSSDDTPAETSSIASLSRSNSAELHAPIKRPGPSSLALGPTLHVPASSTSSAPSLTHSQHSHQSSTSSCISVATDYSSLLHSLEDARISVASTTSSQHAHDVVPSTGTDSRTRFIDKSVDGHARADALGGLNALKSAAGFTDLNCAAPPSPSPGTGSVEPHTEPRTPCGGDTFEWGYAL